MQNFGSQELEYLLYNPVIQSLFSNGSIIPLKIITTKRFIVLVNVFVFAEWEFTH